MGVHHRVALLLPPVGVEALAEVALPVQQAYADHGDAEAARRLEVVAGQYPEAPGVLGQGLGDAELGREVGHFDQRRAAAVLEPAVDAHVAAEVGVDLAQERHECVVLGERLQAFSGHEGEHLYGIVLGALPKLGVDPSEHVTRPLVPGPPEVEREFLQGGQRFWEPGPDGEAPIRFHLRPT